MKTKLILKLIFIGLNLACTFSSINAYATDDKTTIKSEEKGHSALSTFVVDTAPGNVSAMNLLGISSDQTGIIENPKNLTLALKAFDKQKAFGLSITPARTSLIPMDVSLYKDSWSARLWTSTTFSYAQGQADINKRAFDRRAFSVETSYFLEPDKDDVLIMYWNELTAAAERWRKLSPDQKKAKSLDPCVQFSGAEEPSDVAEVSSVKNGTSDAESVKRAAACRDSVVKKARWNVSRVWASYTAGQFQASSGGDSHSLGKMAVLGVTWGVGDKNDKFTSAYTLAFKKTMKAPELKTFDDASPKYQDATLATFRAAAGSETIRLLIEGSNVKNVAPTASNRAYKRAIGIDLKVSEDFWVNFRYGNQRRIDNSGDERGSSLVLSYSPKALLNF